MLALLLAATALAESPLPSSVHADHAALQLGRVDAAPLARPTPMPLPDVTPGPHKRVYGYYAYWSGELADMPWDDLSDIALFSANVDTSGHLSQTSRWGDIEEAVAIAEPYDVRVHLCVTNFDSDELEDLLGSATARQNLIDELSDWVDSSGVHGVNIDFENLPSSRRSEMVTFIADLRAAVGEVVIATPSVDWQNAWDYAALTEHADLFIMGYGYHWSGSEHAGPVDPLYAGSIWSPWTLSKSVDDYKSAGADPDRIILGLPLYGYSWPTADDDVPGENLGTGSSVIWHVASNQAATHGRRFDSESLTPWYYDGSAQTWYADTDSITERFAYAVDDAELGGIGFWALHYDRGDPALWAAVREATVLPLPEDDPDDPVGDPEFTADAGTPFLAYPGDIAVLSGSSSTGPDGLSLRYEWTQVAGPSVELSLREPVRPRFDIYEPGTLAFELRVGDGTRWSAPARTHVVVLDPGMGRRYAGCGCNSTPTTGWAALGLLVVLARRRREARA